jgi:hypothetical protein
MPPESSADSAEPGEPCELDEMVGALAHVGPRSGAASPAVADVSGDGSPWEEARLLEYGRAADIGRVDRHAVDAYFALLVGQKASEDVEQRGLAATGRPDDAHEFAVGYVDGDVREGEEFALLAFEPVAISQLINRQLARRLRPTGNTVALTRRRLSLRPARP